jgi:rSAM/selenodomain-associated transferase 2
VSTPRVSVVIPALDEAAHVERALASVRDADEVIVVDGGSRDRTAALARAAGAAVLLAPRGRGTQLGRGAARATGDWLVFLHADTALERGWKEALHALPREVAGGAFRLAIDSPRPAFRAIEWGVAWRCRLLSLPFGDQGLFARRSAYAEVGGFRPFPLMEDIDFVCRLGRAGRLAFPRPRAFTSPRRWERHGVFGATLRNGWLLAQFAAGRRPEDLARGYHPARALALEATVAAAGPSQWSRRSPEP